VSFDKLIAFVIALALLGAGILIFVGESDDTLWASWTTRQSEPSIEIQP
jgi:hypothetical protein